MKLDDIKAEYHFYTGKVSDLARQLAFAGIAVIWIFKVDEKGAPKIPHPMLAPTAALVLSLLFDFLQYTFGAIAYHIRFETAERRKKKYKLPADQEFKVSRRLVLRPMDVLFYLKAICVVIAYVLLAKFLIRQVTG